MITLYRANSGWIARFDDPAVIEAFGGSDIPTAYTASAPADLVAAEVRRLNPDQSVSIEE